MTVNRPHAVGRRSALVAGASSGIGAAYARRLAADGFDVTLVARREPELTILAAELGQRFRVQAHVVVADLATPEGVDQAINRSADAPVDWLINNAGFGIPGVFDQVPLQRSLAMIQLHLLASTRLSHAVLPGMIGRGRGRVVNVASIGAVLPRPGDATYCATKAYLVTFSRASSPAPASRSMLSAPASPAPTSTKAPSTPSLTSAQPFPGPSGCRRRPSCPPPWRGSHKIAPSASRESRTGS